MVFHSVRSSLALMEERERDALKRELVLPKGRLRPFLCGRFANDRFVQHDLDEEFPAGGQRAMLRLVSAGFDAAGGGRGGGEVFRT